MKQVVPCGVEEDVPRDAVSRRYWRSEPESWSAPPISLPLERIVAVFQLEQQVQNEDTLGCYQACLSFIYNIKHNYSAQTESYTMKCMSSVSRGVLGERSFTTQQLRVFEIWCFMYQISEAEKSIVRVYTDYNYTLEKSEGSVIYLSSRWGKHILRSRSWKV